MNQFKPLIDAYITNYSLFETGKVSFDCDYGELTFRKHKDDTITLYAIYIVPQWRNKGLCREILHYIIDHCSTFTYFKIESVLSKVLYDYLLRFTYKDKKFVLNKKGFIYVIKS